MDLMLDIETLGLEPMSVITQIAAVPFDFKDNSLNFGIDFNINLNNCLNNGAVINGDTLLWTIKNNLQSLENQEQRFTIPEALIRFQRYIKDINPECIWAKSPQFDCSMLEIWYKRCELAIPWKYNQLRDVRTIEYFGKTKLGLGSELDQLHDKYGKKLHNPTTDCHFQIEVIRLVMNHPIPKRVN